MKRKITTVALCMAAALCMGFDLPKELTDSKILRKPIEKIELVKGVTAFHAEYDRLFTDEVGKFELSFLVVEWNLNPNLTLKLWMDKTLVRHRPSEALAENPIGVACVNGFYHATVDPSIPYFPTRIDGKDWDSKKKYIDGVIAFNPYSPPAIGDRSIGYTNYLNFAGADGHPSRNCAFSKAKPDYSDEKKLEKRVNNWTARTFAGHNIAKNFTVFCVADGYVADAMGMTFEEAGWIMATFDIPGSEVSLFDGGGSSTMAVKKDGEVRIINRPRTDHVNVIERRVLTSVQVVERTDWTPEGEQN